MAGGPGRLRSSGPRPGPRKEGAISLSAFVFYDDAAAVPRPGGAGRRRGRRCRLWRPQSPDTSVNNQSKSLPFRWLKPLLLCRRIGCAADLETAALFTAQPTREHEATRCRPVRPAPPLAGEATRCRLWRRRRRGWHIVLPTDIVNFKLGLAHLIYKPTKLFRTKVTRPHLEGAAGRDRTPVTPDADNIRTEHISNIPMIEGRD